jgi:hypothetical protein
LLCPAAAIIRRAFFCLPFRGISVHVRDRRSASSRDKGPVSKFWIGILAVILLGAGLAWIGTAGQQISTTASGLRFRVIEAGTGPTVTPADLVGLEMQGPHRRRHRFHQSQPGQPDVLSTEGLIPGMSEAMLMMREAASTSSGSRRSSLTARLRRRRAASSPNATLEFRVRVLGILEGMAAMQSMMGGRVVRADPVVRAVLVVRCLAVRADRVVRADRCRSVRRARRSAADGPQGAPAPSGAPQPAPGPPQ